MCDSSINETIRKAIASGIKDAYLFAREANGEQVFYLAPSCNAPHIIGMYADLGDPADESIVKDLMASAKGSFHAHRGTL